MKKERLQIDMSMVEAVMTLAENNPGAIRVIMDLIEKAKEIDPQAAMGGLGPLMNLDSLGIYGSDIWLLYKDVCGEDYGAMVAVLRSWQLGINSERVIKHAVQNRGDGIDLTETINTVKEKLRWFDA